MAKVLILYDSQTGNTEKMAQAVAEGARSVPNVEVEVKYYAGPDEFSDAAAIVFGAPTSYHDITLPIKQMLEETAKAGVKLQGKVDAGISCIRCKGERGRALIVHNQENRLSRRMQMRRRQHQGHFTIFIA